MDWELTKENCVPVRQGRSKAALQELADPTTEALETKQKELWAEVAEYKGDDPLEPWQRYIKWMQEYGVGGGKADLLKVLEASTKELLKYPRYTNDIRFLRIWIQYADCLPDPDDVFLFLKERGIGRDFALYYEAYATYFELRGNFQGADAVYIDGIQRGVKQLERLKLKHAAFQQRMAQRVQRQIQDEQVMGPPAQEPVRANLATLGARGTGRALPSQQQSSGGIFGIAAAPQQTTALFGRRIGIAQQARGLQPVIGLQADEEFLGMENPRPWMHGYSSMPQVNSSRELQPYGVRRKENLDRATAWNQASLLPSATAAASGPPGGGDGGLDIFTDEEFQDGGDDFTGRAAELGRCRGTGASVSGASTGQSLLLPGSDRPAGPTVDALMASLAPPRTLLRGVPPGPMHSVSESIAALSLSTATAAPPTAALVQQQKSIALTAPSGAAAAAGPLARQPDGAWAGRSGYAGTGDHPCGGAVERPLSVTTAEGGACDKEGIGGDEEMSYEELRAAAWFRHNPTTRPCDSSTARVGGASNVSSSSHSCGTTLQADPKAAARLAQPLAAPVPTPTASKGSLDAENAVGQGATSFGAGRDACATIAANRRAPFGKVLPDVATAQPALKLPAGSCLTGPEIGFADAGGHNLRRPLSDAAPVVRAPLVQPIGAPVPSFMPDTAQRAPLRAEPPDTTGGHSSSMAGPCRRRHEDAQPTITISTQGAFDLMNSFFSDDLPHQGARADRGQPRSSSIRTVPPLAAPQADAKEPWEKPQVSQPTSASTSVVAPPQPVAPVVEATVTLHTKLAFDALNDMFCDTLPHEEARQLARRVAPVTDSGGRGRSSSGVPHTKPITTSDVCRLANAGRNFAAAVPATGRREPLNHSGDGSGGPHAPHALPGLAPTGAPSLAIHEDTFFLGPAPGALPSDAMRGPVGGASRHAPPVDQPRSNHHAVAPMYEDTEFMPRDTGLAGASSSLAGLGSSCGAVPASNPFILEDTEFVTRHAGPHMTAASGPGGSGEGVPRCSQGTTAVAGSVGRPTDRHACAKKLIIGGSTLGDVQGPKGRLQVYEDTQYSLDD